MMNNKIINNVIYNLSNIRNNKYITLKNIQSNDFCQKNFYRIHSNYRKLDLVSIYNEVIRDNKNVQKNKVSSNKLFNKSTIDNKNVQNNKVSSNKLINNLIIDNKNVQKNKVSSNKVFNIDEQSQLFQSKYITTLTNISEIPLFNNYLYYKINCIEPILFGICVGIYDKFLVLYDDQKIDFMKKLKYKMGIDLDKENLYLKFNYNKKRFKKTDFQDKLINNRLNIGNRFYNYLADYFGLNIIKIENNKIVKYYNDFSHNRFCIVIYYDNNNFTIQYGYINSCLISPDRWFEYKKKFNLKDDFSEKKKTLSKLKLIDIQNRATDLGIVLTKKGKNKLIKKSKKELILEIEIKFISDDI